MPFSVGGGPARQHGACGGVGGHGLFLCASRAEAEPCTQGKDLHCGAVQNLQRGQVGAC